MIEIAASILSADFARLGEEAKAVVEAGAHRIHFDVMDNHYVNNLTIGAMVCKSLRDFGITTPIDTHLMTENVDTLIEPFAKAGSSSILIHPNTTPDAGKTLARIRELGCECGLAINPEEEIDIALPFMDKLDWILLMSVHPGFGGQAFIPSVIDKIHPLRDHIKRHNLNVKIGIDGGVNADNVKMLREAGIDTLIAGSAIFNQDDYAAAISAL